MNLRVSSSQSQPKPRNFGLVDELRMFRYPVVVGGGTPFLPPSPSTSRWS